MPGKGVLCTESMARAAMGRDATRVDAGAVKISACFMRATVAGLQDAIRRAQRWVEVDGGAKVVFNCKHPDRRWRGRG